MVHVPCTCWHSCNAQVSASCARFAHVGKTIFQKPISHCLTAWTSRRDFGQFSRNTVHLNTVSALVPTVLLLLCPRWYIGNRRWLLAIIKAKHLTLTPWHGRVFPRLDTPWAVFFSVVISSRTWVRQGGTFCSKMP